MPPVDVAPTAPVPAPPAVPEPEAEPETAAVTEIPEVAQVPEVPEVPEVEHPVEVTAPAVIEPPEDVQPVEEEPEPVQAPEEAAGSAPEPEIDLDAIESSIAEETPTKERTGEVPVVATVPESRRAQAQARRQAHEKSKAERAARKAQQRSQRSTQGAADAVASRLPTMRPAIAALLTGVISGGIGVALTWGEVNGCEAIRGHNNCNDGFGLLAIVVILAVEIIIGANLLKAFKVTDPFSTSFLGVALVAMVVMFTFMGEDKMDSPIMVVVIPALTAVAFLLSWWVTVRFIEDPDDR